ncbi:iron uptake porin [Geitlerinema sp. PCC 7407]|uniref:iron uptake porin n=1 Tax=Geitlerinema sp. PCC 7407 TaxID=1173025 RepID=UPI0012370AB3|nr:iron uptake porin [Geitlerinema sp. PCC 7407]
MIFRTVKRAAIALSFLGCLSPSLLPQTVLAQEPSLSPEADRLASMDSWPPIPQPDPALFRPRDRWQSVHQLDAIAPSSWEFQAFGELAERHGCFAGLPADAYAGDAPLSRSAFAVGLSYCLARIEQQIQNGATLTTDELAALERLQATFAAELAGLGQPVSNLEARAATLERQTFSSTAELEGQAIFGLGGIWGRSRADDGDRAIPRNLFLGDRVELTLEASFSGSDELEITLQGRSVPELDAVTGTPMGNLGFDGADDNEVTLDELGYEFPVGDRTTISLGAVGTGVGDLLPTINPDFSGSEDGSISTFGRENPIRRQGEGAGLGITHRLSEAATLSLGYVASDPSTPETGLTQSPYSAIAQLTLQPSEAVSLALSYLHTYNNVSTGTGSNLANQPFGEDADDLIGDSLGGEIAWNISPQTTLGARLGWTRAIASDLPDEPSADLFTWALMAAVRDIGQEGDLAGLLVGQPPKVIRNSLGDDATDPGTSLHIEAFYRFPVGDRLSLTPGFFLITQPDHNADNKPLYIGVLRGTFTF